MNIEVRPYFAEGEMYPALIGVRAEGDEYETAYVSKSELVDALADNAKLREMVRILKNCADECGDCDTCPINDGPGVLNPWLGCDGLHDRMRELGIEVN